MDPLRCFGDLTSDAATDHSVTIKKREPASNLALRCLAPDISGNFSRIVPVLLGRATDFREAYGARELAPAF